MRILVTGASGFIGTHLCDKLTNLGHDPIRFDISEDADITGDLTDIDWFNLELGDLDGVVHLAAKTSVPESISNPEEYRITNVEGSRRLFDWCNKIGIPSVVFASSAAVYGDSKSEKKTVGEEGILGSPYAETKLLGEKLAKEYSSLHTKFVCLRFFNVYGPGQAVNPNYSAVIPSFIARSLKSEDLEIFGDGNQTRDFVHVHDVCEAIIGSLISDIENYAVINIGSGKGVSIRKLAETIVGLAVKNDIPPSRLIFRENREGDIEHSIADIENLNHLIRIKEMIPLEIGLEELFTKHMQ